MSNTVHIIGRLGKDPAMRNTAGGKQVCNFSIASKEMGGTTEWFNVTVWGKSAENCTKFLKKGSMAYVVGNQKTNEYEKDGQKKTFVSIHTSSVEFLDSKPQGQNQSQGHYNQSPPQNNNYQAAPPVQPSYNAAPPPPTSPSNAAGPPVEDNLPF